MLLLVEKTTESLTHSLSSYENEMLGGGTLESENQLKANRVTTYGQ